PSRPPRATLFPYTTLFRSTRGTGGRGHSQHAIPSGLPKGTQEGGERRWRAVRDGRCNPYTAFHRPSPSPTAYQFQLHHGREALAVMGSEAERRERGEVVRGGVTLVARPGVQGMASRQQLHQAIAHGFRDHRRGGDRVAVGV